MRRALTLLHRWIGLCTAVFLFIAGLTGALIAWDHELDGWLNPRLYRAQSAAHVSGEPMSALAIAERIEREDPRVRVRWLPLSAEPGHTLILFVDPRVDPATGKPFELGFDQVAVDPMSGEVQARRLWGEVSLARENLMPFLYKLHYSLHLPPAFGLEPGVLLMGVIGIAWTFDCFIALWISFPSRRSWRRSFAFRFRQGGHKLNFDLHRSGGVWIWALLLTLSVTSVSMNLHDEVMRPLVSVFSDLTLNPFDARTPNPPEQPIEPLVGRAQVIARARVEAQRRGLDAPPGGVFYAAEYGLYGVGLYQPGKDHGDGGLGNPWLYFDGRDGAPAGAEVPGQGSAGDVFMQAQFPLHSGRILGVPGRALVSAIGSLVAMLSATGVVIWARRRRMRAARAREDEREPAAGAEPSLTT